MAASLRAASFNVRTAVADDGEDDWEHRRDLVAAVLRFHRPDVVGLQEALAEQIEFLDEALAGYEWVGESRGSEPGEGEFVPVFYRRERFALEASETFWLSETPAEPGSVGWGGEHPRIATTARLRDRETGATFQHCNAHLSHVDGRARREGARLVRERAGSPAVVTGDWNCEPGSPPYRAMVGADGVGEPFVDAREATADPPLGPARTKHAFDGEPTARIDYVFARGFDVCGYATPTDHAAGRYPSDHFPVVADLQPARAPRHRGEL